MRLAPMLLFAIATVTSACETPGRSVRTWIEAHDAQGATVAGAAVTIDGRPLGITDHRGLFRVKIRRHTGSTVSVRVADESRSQAWEGSFTVGTNGGPAGVAADRLVVVLTPST